MLKANIAVLVSGGGTNLQALIDFEAKNADCPYEIVLVLSDHKDAYALERAKNENSSLYWILYKVVNKEEH